MSFFHQVFACCLRAPRETSAEPDEHTRLIPPSSAGPPPMILPIPALDSQKTKERLEVIVKAKAGKMLSIADAELRFNMSRNDSLSPHIRGSSSRSERGSPVKPPYASSGLGHIGNAGRRASDRPSAATSRSASTTSLAINSVSGAFHGHYEREPMNLRLVRPGDVSDDVRSRGRPRGRSGKGIDITDLTQDDSYGGDPEVSTNGVQSSDGEGTTTDVGLESIEEMASPFSSPKSFHMEEVGNISRGWGD